MSDTEVESLNTVSSSFFEEALANIKSCADDCHKEDITADEYINFSTVLDYYINDWNVFTVQERLQIMDLLYKVFSNDRALLAEVSWDLPELLLPFLDCSWPIRAGLRNSVQIIAFYKVFNLIAEFGNPKELLVNCCEEIKKLKDTENEIIEIDENQVEDIKAVLETEFYSSLQSNLEETIKTYSQTYPGIKLVVKFHALIECIRFSIERIETIYPSRILGIVIQALINFIHNAPAASNSIPFLRTLYLFIRDYAPPNFPNEVLESKELTPEELEKLFKDESYLQQKLIRCLFDALVDKLSLGHYTALVSKIVPAFSTAIEPADGAYYVELMNRILSLALTLDVDIVGTLSSEIENTKNLFTKNIAALESTEDILNLVIKAYNDSSFRTKDPSKLPISETSVAVLYVWAKYVENWKLTLPQSISTMDLIEFQLAIFIPYTIKPQLANSTLIAFLIIVTSITAERKKLIFPKTNIKEYKLVVFTYLQTLSSLAQISPNKTISKKLFANFFKKFIQHMPPDIAYEFIIDTLTHCPHQDTILNVLITYALLINTGKYDTEKLTKDLAEVSISKGPKLPARNIETIPTFIDFDDKKQRDFVKVLESTVNDSVQEKQLLPHQAGKIVSIAGFIRQVKFSEDNKKQIIESLKGLKPILADVTETKDSANMIAKLNHIIDQFSETV